MIKRANEIDSSAQNKDKMRKESVYNMHMKRLSVNRQVINGYQNAAVNKSVDMIQQSKSTNNIMNANKIGKAEQRFNQVSNKNLNGLN